jgi:hypothetical protein
VQGPVPGPEGAARGLCEPLEREQPLCSWGTRELDTEWRLFLNYRAGYDLDKACTASAKRRPTKAEAKPVEAKPRIRVRAPSQLLMSDVVSDPNQFSMTEVLRTYGHIPEVRA